MLDCLRFYVSQGWPLFPCSSLDKSPLTPRGFKDASLDWPQIEEWHRRLPGCAWGTPTSAERGVLDIDPRHKGDATLAALLARHGPLPPTPRVRTGGGGHHYYLSLPSGTRCRKVGEGIDLKAEGGYVIIPPSRIDCPEHAGRAYQWEVKPWESAIADAPGWLLGTPKPKPTPMASAEADNPWVVREAVADLLTHPGADKDRHNALCQLVGVHIARGDSPSTIYPLAEAWAKRCTPMLERWREHVDGLMRKEQAKAGRLTGNITSPTPVLGNPGTGREGNNSGPVSQGELVPSPEFPPHESAGHEAGVSSLPPPSGESEQGGGDNCLSFVKPALQPEAYYGLLGRMLEAIGPETEADPAGILLGWLACFGSVVGRGAWVQVGPRRHHPALFVGVVGRTSDAKGDSWAASLWPFKKVQAPWAAACIANGVGSGEGLIERVADAQTYIGKDGEVKEIPGAEDKRCLLRLSELSRCFKAGRRENATLSEHLREAWDGEPIHVPNRKGNALSASEYAISLVGDITPGVLHKLLERGTEGFDGFANRFLWCAVESPRSLPSGGNVGVLEPFLMPLAEALAFGKAAGELKRDADADALWASLYPSLKASGDAVPHTDRARPYVLRLALLYALADQSQTIRVEHLRAALAVWDYCRQSARLIFGQGQEGEADPLWLRLMNAIVRSPGISRTGLRDVAGHKVPAADIDAALEGLRASGKAYSRMVQPAGSGRPAECWFPGVEGEGEGAEADKHPPTPWIVQPDAETTGREGKNSPPTGAGEFPPPTGGEGTNSADGGGASLLPPSPAELLDAILAAEARGGRVCWQWRKDDGSGEPGCVLLVDKEHSSPELDALCLAHQDLLRLVYPIVDENEAAEECLRDAIGA